MAYDEELAGRVRELVSGEPGVSEKKMFGGLAMLLDGHMAVGIRGSGGLMVRVDPEQTDHLLNEPGTALMEMRGRGMAGWMTVDPVAVESDADLERWVTRGVSYARTLPPK